MAGTGLAIGLICALLVVVEAIDRRVGLPPEASRKVVHVGSAALAAALAFVLTRQEIVLLALAFALTMLLSRQFDLLRSVHHVERSTWGEVYYPIGVAAIAVLATSRAQFVYGVLVLGLADGLAGIIGQRYGRTRIPIVPTTKSAVGTSTFFVAALAIGTVTLMTVGHPFGPALILAGLAAGLLATVEVSLGGGLDNFCVPVVAVLLLRLAS